MIKNVELFDQLINVAEKLDFFIVCPTTVDAVMNGLRDKPLSD